MAMPRPPQNGVLIGGTQTRDSARANRTTPTQARLVASGGDSAASSRVGAGTGSAFALWLPLVGVDPRAAPASRAARGEPHALRASWLLLLAAAAATAAVRPRTATPARRVPPGALTREQLRDPETCKGCHPNHYREWSSSMHAYAAQDPVFVAMNKRGQRETHGELGDFCVKCHAPMAVVDKRTQRRPRPRPAAGQRARRELLLLPQRRPASTATTTRCCTWPTTPRCAVRSAIRVSPARTGPSSPRCSRTRARRARRCAAAATTSSRRAAFTSSARSRSIATGMFSKSATGAPPAFDSCVGCHMPGQQAFAAVAPGRRRAHGARAPVARHRRAADRLSASRCAAQRRGGLPARRASVSFFTLEVTPPDLFTFQIETNAGHNQPSGAAQDRRMWLEFLAYDASGKLLDQVSSGNIADGEIEEKPEGDPKHDPHLLMFRDRIYDAQGKPVHMFWQAAKSQALIPTATSRTCFRWHRRRTSRASTPC